MSESFDKKSAAENSDVQRQICEIDKVIAKYNDMIMASKAREKAAETITTGAFKKKMLVMALVMCFSLVTFISSTFAYFTATSSSGGNVIATGSAGSDLVDLVYPQGSTEGIPVEEFVGTFAALPGDGIRRSVSAVNRGAASVYVRARVDCNITLKSEYARFSDEIDNSLILYEVGDSWLARDTFDGYYYYKTTLPRGAESPDFINNISFSNDMGNIYKGATVAVKVVFEIVQAEGNGETVFDAVGWPASEEGGGAL